MVVSKNEIIEKIKQDWNETPQSSICIEIISHLAKTKNQENRHITYSNIKQISQNNDTGEILKAIQYLCGINVLVIKYELIEGDQHLDISDTEINEAYKIGGLVHPISGKIITDFRNKISVYFQPNLYIED